MTQVGPGTLRYTPAAGFTGVATFGYVVADGNGGSDTGTVSVTVAPRLEILDASVTEGNSGLVDLVFTVQLTGPSPTAVSATLTTANRTATAGADYEATTGTVTIPAGTLSVTVPVRSSATCSTSRTRPLRPRSPARAAPRSATGPRRGRSSTTTAAGALGQRRQHRRGQPRDDRNGVQGRAQLGEREDDLGRVRDGGHRRDCRRRLPDRRRARSRSTRRDAHPCSSR